MFLKALTLKGFKSFADATTLELEPGVSVVVGPNGSGKSNVVDAIAWVLGAQAPSAVRSQKMDDVIFAGTAKRSALGRAEVSLTLDNSAGLLPIEFTEVTVRRTLFRSGESEYAINGAPCRLLDVQELLSDAGVGRQQHVIVSQGQIDAVLNARPEERRAIVEEAAGVLKYRKRKEKAERRLDATEASLLRVQDLLREVRRQLRPLERQAEAARRHGDLVTELSALQIFLAGREIAAHRSRLVALAGERQAAASQEASLRSELAALDTGVLSAEAELTSRGDSDIGDEMVRVEQLRERSRGVAAVLVERRRSMERDRGALMDSGVVANLEADAAKLQAEFSDVESALAAVGPEAQRLTDDEAEFVLQREAAAETVEQFAGARSGPSAASAAAEVRGELRSLRHTLERAETDQRQQRGRIDGLRQRADRLEAEAERLFLECESAEGAEAALVAEAEGAEARRLAATAAHEAALDERQRAAEESSRWTARAEALRQALETAHARAGTERLAGVDGVLGTLLDLVEIDPGWETVTEAALGEVLEAVVVESPAAARRALAALHEGNVHGAVLALGVHATAAPLPHRSGAVRPHVRSDDTAVAALLDVVLAGAVRVEGWSDAVDAVLADLATVAVTDAGDRFGSAGWRIGAADGGGVTAAALAEADERAGQAVTELDERDRAFTAATAALQVARDHEQAVTRRLDAHDAAFSASSSGLARARSGRRDLLDEIAVLETAAAETGQRMDRERGRADELAAMVPALEADEEAEVAAARARGEARARIEARAAQLAAARQDLEVRNAGLHERRSYIERRLAEIERRLAADLEARAAAADRRAVVERDLGVVERLSALVDVHRHAVEQRHVALLEVRRRQSDEVRSIAGRLDDLRRRRTAAERGLDELRERSRRAEVDEAEVRLRLETAVEAIRRDHSVEPEVAEAAEMPPLPDGTNAPARMRELERELRLMGPINPLALEEFNELQERHRFLEEQLDDVRNTRRDLLRVIKAVDLEIQTVFAAAYADVSTHFASLFATLFPGGTGRLVLTNPDDLLNTGIEVEAKPGGKNVKKLSLLSGGERSLTALAFLFAVFRSRPSPFYVMDEVEAALDDVNLHRFLGLIDEFRREAQLLIVSHQKRTMEAGDCLLGVTMQPGGSSKVVVERASAAAG